MVQKSYLKRNIIIVMLPLLFVIAICFLLFSNNDGKKGVVQTNSKLVLENALASLDIMETLSFTEDKSVFINPEKGFYKAYRSNSSSLLSLSSFKTLNLSLLMLKVDLAAFKTGPISDAKLSEISNAFNLARQAGLKIIFRAAYDFDGVRSPEPTDINIILNHINQFKPIFIANEDILYCVQAGFLGPWGEWHGSYYSTTNGDLQLTARQKIMTALMDAVPSSKMIQIRSPRYIRDMYASAGNVMNDSMAFNGSNLARTGFHDDGMLHDANDDGTFNREAGYDREAELNWANVQMKYTPFGGESNGVSSYSDPDVVMPYLEKLHAQYLNLTYYPDVITKWKNTTYNGENTFDYISQRLGYKYLLTSAKISSKVYVGGAMHLNLSIQNKGFGNLMNPRTFEIVLSNGTTTYKSKVNDDPRKWYRENGVMVKDLYFTIPSNIKPGNWNVYLNLPDASESLKNNPNYSIRLANTGVWNPTTGYNLLKSGLVVEDVGLTNTNLIFAQTNRSHAEEIMGISIGVPVTSVSLTPKNLSIQSGSSTSLSATVLPENATEKSVTYSSSNSSVATVDSKGTVVAVAPGTAIITVTTLSEAKTATSNITVFAPTPIVIPVTSITLSPQEKTISKGQTFSLATTVLPENATNKNVSYTSSNSSVVTVSNTGVVTAISAGTATITVTSVSDGKIATCTVTVLQPVESVSLPVQNLSVEVGQTYVLTGAVNPASASNPRLTYTSSNPSVVTVDSLGKITALATGTAVITAKSVDGNKTATCTVGVIAKSIGTISTWNDVNSIAERINANANVMKAYNNSTTLYLLVTGSNLNKKNQFYINTDNNTNTGFKSIWSSSGIEYLIEDGHLYKYSGRNNRWDWRLVTDASLVISNNRIGISIPLSKLGITINNTIQIGFMSGDVRDNTLPIKSLPMATYTIGNGTNIMEF